MQDIFSKISDAIQGNKAAALCIVISTSGSTPRKEGAKMIVYTDGSAYGSIGGGSIEKEVIEMAVRNIPAGMPVKASFNLEADLGMHCGGKMEVYIEPLQTMPKLFIFGAGHIGKALSGFARELGFTVTLFDPRGEIFRDDAFTGFTCVNRDYFEAIAETGFDNTTYIVIVTPKRRYDEDILAAVARKPHAYLGMIGSERKVDLLKNRFLKENILTAEELDAIDMPIGIPFRAETPGEIAVSILAKIIDVKNALFRRER